MTVTIEPHLSPIPSAASDLLVFVRTPQYAPINPPLHLQRLNRTLKVDRVTASRTRDAHSHGDRGCRQFSTNRTNSDGTAAQTPSRDAIDGICGIWRAGT
jgi:hypothetical protein